MPCNYRERPDRCRGGVLVPTGNVLGGYPVSACDRCTAFCVENVEGKEPALRWTLRRLHEMGCEPGRVDAEPSA